MTSRIETLSEDFDIDAREAQVMAKPRIGPLKKEEFTDAARQLAEETLAIFGRIDQDDIPFIFGTLFKHPGVFRSHMQIGVELNKYGVLPPREKELAVLRVAWLSRAPFEWGQHVEYAKKYGVTAEEIERITRGSDAPGWSEHDRAVVRAVEELIGDHAISDQTWDILAKTWTEAQLMELPVLVGGYLITAMLYNTLRFDLLEGNRGLRHR